MFIDDDEIHRQLPELAKKSFTEAREKAMLSRGWLLEAREGNLVKVYADGSCEVLRKLIPPVITRGNDV